MPSADAILSSLRLVANAYWPLAIAWHGLLLLAIVAWTAPRLRPSQRTAGALLALPLLSVSALAWRTDNPFSGTTFFVLAIALASIATTLHRGQLELGPAWARVLGGLVVAYAWVYPHFVDGPWWSYAIASPLGLVPCPTLGAVLGLGLLAGGFRSRSWSLVTAIAGLFYAGFGILRLGVWLDAGLGVAAVGMLVMASRPSPRRVSSGAAEQRPEADAGKVPTPRA